MKKNLFIVVMALCAIVMSSCRSKLSVIPQALNTIHPVELKDLNLERKDYIILKTITAEAMIHVHYTEKVIKMEDASGEFSMSWVVDKTGAWSAANIKGVARLGYLGNDYENELFDIAKYPYPHWIVRRLAIYRLINAAKVAGGDGVIEPIISTNVEQGRGRNDIVYKTTVSAKLIKIKPDGK